MAANLIKSAVKRVFGFFVVRPLQRFDVERRAEKVISKEKPESAPRHETTEKSIQQMIKDDPEIKAAVREKKDDLVLRLKHVHVTDHAIDLNDVPMDQNKSTARLPKLRSTTAIPISGVVEPKNIIPGKITISQAHEIITNHNKEPNVWTYDYISDKYNLNVNHVKMLVTNFRPFLVYTPESGEYTTAGSTFFKDPIFLNIDKMVEEKERLDLRNKVLESGEKQTNEKKL